MAGASRLVARRGGSCGAAFKLAAMDAVQPQRAWGLRPAARRSVLIIAGHPGAAANFSCSHLVVDFSRCGRAASEALTQTATQAFLLAE